MLSGRQMHFFTQDILQMPPNCPLFLLALEIVPMCMESLKLPSRKYVGSEFFVLLSCLPITFQGGRPKQDSLGVMWTTSRLAH